MLFSAVNEIAYLLSAPMINSLLPVVVAELPVVVAELPGAWCPW